MGWDVMGWYGRGRARGKSWASSEKSEKAKDSPEMPSYVHQSSQLTASRTAKRERGRAGEWKVFVNKDAIGTVAAKRGLRVIRGHSH